MSEKEALRIAWTGHRPRAYSVQYSRYRAQRLVPGQTQTAAFFEFQIQRIKARSSGSNALHVYNDPMKK